MKNSNRPLKNNTRYRVPWCGASGSSTAILAAIVRIPVKMSHSMIPEEERRAIGVTENLGRVSVGLEGTEDLIADLDRDIVDAPQKTHPVADPDAENQQAESTNNGSCVSADLDFVVFGPGGIRVVKNELNAESGKRTLEIVSQPDEFDAQKNLGYQLKRLAKVLEADIRLKGMHEWLIIMII